MALPSRVRVLSHLSHERSEAEATMFLATFKARTDGDAPFFTSDQLPAYVAAWIANDSTPEPPPRTRGPGRPRKAPKRVVDPHLRYAQVDKRRVGGRVVEVKRHILFGAEADIVQVLATDRCGAQINTSYVERDNLTSRHSNGRLVRKTLSHSKKKAYLQRHIDLEAAIYNFASCKYFGVQAAACSGNQCCSHWPLSSTTLRIPSALLPTALQLMPLPFCRTPMT